MTLQQSKVEALRRWPIIGIAWEQPNTKDGRNRCLVGVEKPDHSRNAPGALVYGSGDSFEAAFEDATKQGH